MNIHHLLVIMLISLNIFLTARSPFRTPDPSAPRIEVKWKGDKNGVVYCDPYFRQFPLFNYGTEDILGELIPNEISYANDPDKKLTKQEIDDALENLIQELYKARRKIRRPKEFKEFKVLQFKNYSFRRRCGLIVLKFKKHPFVLKLFMERPKTFLDPYIKGMEPVFFHYMAGGINRHISGLTRVKNLNLMKKVIGNDTLWAGHIYFPRKWYWLPKDHKDLQLVGANLAENKLVLNVPSIYGIIADYIDVEKQVDIPLYDRKKLVMQFSNDISTYIDPHFNNFVFKEDVVDGEDTYKIVVIDTEHFPTFVGLEKSKHFKTHHAWYIHLAKKCMHDMYFTTKRERAYKRTFKSPLSLDSPIFYQKTL